MRLLKEAGHRRWRRHLSAYVDGRLGPSHQAALERHLAMCLLCQEELTALRRVVALLRQVPQVEAPRSFALSQVPSLRPRRPALYVRPLRYATAVTAMLLLAVVVGDLVITRPTALAPASPGVAETQSKEVPKESADTRAAATAAPLAVGQDTTQATPSPQPLPFVAAEKAQETMEAVVPLATTPNESGTLHNWFRRGEISIGAVLAALITVLTFQWREGHRHRHS